MTTNSDNSLALSANSSAFCDCRLKVLFVALLCSTFLLIAQAFSDGLRSISAGDLLLVAVEESPDLNGTYAVLGDGTLDFRYAGRVPVEGKNIYEAAAAIKAKLEEGFFKKATVEVEISEYFAGNILLLGAVSNPGIIPNKGTELITLVEAILGPGGGLNSRAAADQVKIFRRKPGGDAMERITIPVDLTKFFDGYEFHRDQYLRPRDIVVVPEMGASADAPPSEFLILGEFPAPGFYPAPQNLNMIRAITMAGGVSREARLETARILRPGADGSYSVIPVDLARLFGSADMSMNLNVYPGDILFLPSASQASGGVVYFLGALSNPGIYSLPFTGAATLARTMLQRGGFNNFSNQKAVKILRKDPDGSRRTLEFNVGQILESGNFDKDLPLQNEDVIIVPERLISLF